MPEPESNHRLHESYLGDQKDREDVYSSPAKVDDLMARDKLRRESVYEMITQGQVRTPADFYHAAVILQHGSEARDYLTAHRMAVLSAIGGHQPARWLLAATLDRYLMAVGQAQVYGTQFEYDEGANRYRLKLPIEESSVLPSEKDILDVPSVPDRLKQLNERAEGR
ncbi:MAG: hypothetical protein HY927_13110 [Elusimicrobia bacterium]|nr:hypothetical protein [Elusimicrobiota bacterium]